MKIFNKLLYISNKIDRDISFRMKYRTHPDSLYIGYKNITGMQDAVYFIFIFLEIKDIKFYNIDFNKLEHLLSISDFIKRINLIEHIRSNKKYIKTYEKTY